MLGLAAAITGVFLSQALDLPILDGVAATRSIRALLPHTVLVGMSCHSRDMAEKAMLSADVDVFLPKDMLGQELLPMVEQVLARRA